MGTCRPKHGSNPWLGQHFLRSRRLAASLVQQTNVSASDLVVEIGAGYGILTRALARRAAQVIAVEIDPTLAINLVKRFSNDGKVLVVSGDFFDLPLPAAPFRVFGNIPFGSTTSLLRHLLSTTDAPIMQVDVIVQRGVAIKRTRGWNLLNLCWAPWWEFKIAARIPPSAFKPPTTVEAALLAISKRRTPLLPELEKRGFFEFARAAWHASTVRDAMRPFMSARRLQDLSKELGSSLTVAPAELDIHQWVTLYDLRSN